MNNKLKFLSVISLVFLTSCGETIPQEFNYSFKTEEHQDIHTSEQKEFLESSYTVGVSGDLGERSLPNPIHISWDSLFSGSKPKEYKVAISEDEDLSNSYNIVTKDTECDFYNAKVNTTYYYQVDAIYSNTSFASPIQSFNTLENPYIRNLYIDGVTNSRDLGGKNIKQGLLYRTSEFNDENGNITISSQGIATITEQLKIKTEIDVRKDSENGGITSSVIPELNYVHIPMGYSGGGVILTYSDDTISNPAAFKTFFETLANEDNYPIAFHCTFGRDRTGFLSYLLRAICGEDEETIYHDYLFTNFSSVSSTKIENITKGTSMYTNVFKKEGKDTLKENVISYLTRTDEGYPNISLETINRVIDIIKA